MTSHKQRVHAVLLAAFAAGPYRPASHDAAGALVVDDVGTSVPPTVLTNEIGATFGDAERNRRELLDEKLTWTWVGLVHFEEQVSFEDFEKAWAKPLIIVADIPNGQPQCRAHLTRSEYTHPVTQEPGVGSQARFTIEVNVGPT